MDGKKGVESEGCSTIIFEGCLHGRSGIRLLNHRSMVKSPCNKNAFYRCDFVNYVKRKKGISSHKVIGRKTERMAVHSLSLTASFANYTIISLYLAHLYKITLSDLGDICQHH